MDKEEYHQELYKSKREAAFADEWDSLLFDISDTYSPCPCGCGKKFRFALKEGLDKHQQDYVARRMKEDK